MAQELLNAMYRPVVQEIPMFKGVTARSPVTYLVQQ